MLRYADLIIILGLFKTGVSSWCMSASG